MTDFLYLYQPPVFIVDMEYEYTGVRQIVQVVTIIQVAAFYGTARNIVNRKLVAAVGIEGLYIIAINCCNPFRVVQGLEIINSCISTFIYNQVRWSIRTWVLWVVTVTILDFIVICLYLKKMLDWSYSFKVMV